jgi:hypothetical protein
MENKKSVDLSHKEIIVDEVWNLFKDAFPPAIRDMGYTPLKALM